MKKIERRTGMAGWLKKILIMGIVFLMILGLFGCHAKTEETAGVGKKTTELSLIHISA